MLTLYYFGLLYLAHSSLSFIILSVSFIWSYVTLHLFGLIYLFLSTWLKHHDDLDNTLDLILFGYYTLIT